MMGSDLDHVKETHRYLNLTFQVWHDLFIKQQMKNNRIQLNIRKVKNSTVENIVYMKKITEIWFAWVILILFTWTRCTILFDEWMKNLSARSIDSILIFIVLSNWAKTQLIRYEILHLRRVLILWTEIEWEFTKTLLVF